MVVKYRRGIAMVELIFALVIMGIVLMSAPMLIRQSIDSSNVALQQEAIAAAASQTAIVLSMHWDENNSNIPPGESPILSTNRIPFDFFNFTPEISPRGLPPTMTGRTSGLTLLTPTPNTALGLDEIGDIYGDIDDYSGQYFNLVLFNGEVADDIGDYIDADINISTKINYAEDRVDTGITTLSSLTGDINLSNNINSNTPTDINNFTNIKFITVNLTTPSRGDEELDRALDKNITMKAFSCNIGTYAVYGKGTP